MKESWHRSLARALSVPALADDGAKLEIAFGQLRAVVVYVLELARAHRLAATGNVAGDDVWLALGMARVRFTLNRRDGVVVIRTLRGEERLAWSQVAHALFDANGRDHDLTAVAQRAIDELVVHWQGEPSQRYAATKTTAREFEDEPTKG